LRPPGTRTPCDFALPIQRRPCLDICVDVIQRNLCPRLHFLAGHERCDDDNKNKKHKNTNNYKGQEKEKEKKRKEKKRKIKTRRRRRRRRTTTTTRGARATCSAPLFLARVPLFAPSLRATGPTSGSIEPGAVRMLYHHII
jgi:hypothetical protein